MNPVLQNEALVFPQQQVIDVTVVTNHSDQSEVFVAQQPREPLNAFNCEEIKVQNQMGNNWNNNILGIWMLLEDMKHLK